MSMSAGSIPVLPMVSSAIMRYSPTNRPVNGTFVPASATYDSAGLAVYLPIILPSLVVVRRVWWANGATTTGGATVEVGVYSSNAAFEPATKLVSGSATQGTALEVQFVDVTDTSLPPGSYWIAISASTATNTTFMRSNLTTYAKAHRMQEASAAPLPATATPVVATAQTLWLFGFATTASP